MMLFIVHNSSVGLWWEWILSIYFIPMCVLVFCVLHCPDWECFPWEIGVAFPKESQMGQSCYLVIIHPEFLLWVL